MNRRQAEKIMKSLVAIEHNLGELDVVISDISDEAEKKEFIDSLGKLMLIHYNDFFVKVCQQFPDLNYDKEIYFPSARPGLQPNCNVSASTAAYNSYFVSCKSTDNISTSSQPSNTLAIKNIFFINPSLSIITRLNRVTQYPLKSDVFRKTHKTKTGINLAGLGLNRLSIICIQKPGNDIHIIKEPITPPSDLMRRYVLFSCPDNRAVQSA